MILGECIEEIGDIEMHGRAERTWTSKDGNYTGGYRKRGFGKGGANDYYDFDKNGTKTNFPLWSAGDFRQTVGGTDLTLSGSTEFDWKAANEKVSFGDSQSAAST